MKKLFFLSMICFILLSCKSYVHLNQSTKNIPAPLMINKIIETPTPLPTLLSIPSPTPSPSPSASPAPLPVPEDLAATLEINPNEISVSSIGIEKQLNVTIKTKNGKILTDKLIKWQSSDKRILTVNEKGLMKILDYGEVTVTAEYEKLKAIAKVKVGGSGGGGGGGGGGGNPLPPQNPVSDPVPKGLNATDITTTSFKLNWTAVTGADSYKVYQDGAEVDPLAPPKTGVSYNITGLTPNTPYTMTVKSVTGGIDSDPSSPLNVTTADPVPTGLNATDIAITSFKLNWTAVPGANSYKIYKGGFYDEVFGETSTSKDITGLTENTPYTMTVTSKNNGVESLPSISLNVTTLVDPVPKGLNATNITTTSFKLNWTAVTNADSYKIYKNGTEVDPLAPPKTDLFYNITGLTSNITYTMTVKSVTGGIDSDPSTPLNVATLANNPVPAGLNATDITTTNFKLNWAGVDGADGYKVYKDGVEVDPLVIPKTNLFYDITGLAPNTTYAMTVKSVIGGIDSGPSNPLNVTTLTNVPEGTQKWAVATGNYVYSSPAIGLDGTIYVGSEDSKLYALNPADGSEKRPAVATGDVIYSSPAIGTDGTIYIGSMNTKLYAINPADGSEKWTFPTGGGIYASPAIGADGTIYVGSSDSKLYAINPDGTQKWLFATDSAICSSAAIGADGTIYVGSFDKKLYARNPDGTPKWTFTTGAGIYASPAIGADGTIYVGSEDNKFYAINPDGSQKWIFTTGGDIYSGAAIGNNGTIYVGSFDWNLYALNPGDGSPKWVFEVAGERIGSSAAIGADGTIYVGSYDSKIYAISSASAGLANTPWAKFHKNNMNTGR